MDKIEQVPPSSQILILPFLAAVAGFLKSQAGVRGYRLTMHRVISRTGKNYLQQIVNYVASDADGEVGQGRIFEVDTGIIGGAFSRKNVMRTKKFNTIDDLEKVLQPENFTVKDLNLISGDNSNFKKISPSYLAIPFICKKSENSGDRICLIFYADTDFNVFANDAIVSTIINMCQIYCDQIDKIITEDIYGIQNFPPNLANSTDAVGGGGMFTFNEIFQTPLPKFNSIEEGFNFEYVT